MDWNQIIQDTMLAVAPFVGSVVVGLIIIGAKRANAWILANVESKRMQTALWQLSETVTSTVMDLEQEVRKGFADGEFTKDEQVALKTQARDRIKTQAPKALQILAQAGLQDLDMFINGKIEQAVADMPSSTAKLTVTH